MVFILYTLPTLLLKGVMKHPLLRRQHLVGTMFTKSCGCGEGGTASSAMPVSWVVCVCVEVLQVMCSICRMHRLCWRRGVVAVVPTLAPWMLLVLWQHVSLL